MSSTLICSKRGEGVPIALRLATEGAIVKLLVSDRRAQDGLLGYKNPSILTSLKMLDQYDLVLFDMTGNGRLADSLKKKDKLVIGGGTFNDKIELDKEYREKVIKQLIDNLLLEGNPEGVNIFTEGWFNGKSWSPCFNHAIEYKRLMEGEMGPKTDCMGSVVWMTDENEIIKQALLPLVPLLQKVDYLGPLTVSCIATTENLYFLEFIARFRYDAVQALLELYKGNLFDFFWKIATQDDKDMQFRDDYAISVRMSMPPYPFVPQEGLPQNKGIQVLQLENGARPHVFLTDVMLENEIEVLAGVNGVVGCVTARGESIQEVRRRAYRTLKRSVISKDVQYRKDIGAGVEDKISKLKEWGWLNAS